MLVAWRGVALMAWRGASFGVSSDGPCICGAECLLLHKFLKKLLTDEQNGLFGCYYCRKGKHLKFNKVKTTNIENELLATKAELMRYARHLTRDEERARDLMQETVLKILVGRDKYEC